jgi:hypothetical protein
MFNSFSLRFAFLASFAVLFREIFVAISAFNELSNFLFASNELEGNQEKLSFFESSGVFPFPST